MFLTFLVVQIIGFLFAVCCAFSSKKEEAVDPLEHYRHL